MNLLNVGIRNSKSQFNNLNEFSFIDGSIYYTWPDNSEDIDFGIIASDATTLLVHLTTFYDNAQQSYRLAASTYNPDTNKRGPSAYFYVPYSYAVHDCCSVGNKAYFTGVTSEDKAVSWCVTFTAPSTLTLTNMPNWQQYYDAYRFASSAISPTGSVYYLGSKGIVYSTPLNIQKGTFASNGFLSDSVIFQAAQLGYGSCTAIGNGAGLAFISVGGTRVSNDIDGNLSSTFFNTNDQYNISNDLPRKCVFGSLIKLSPTTYAIWW